MHCRFFRARARTVDADVLTDELRVNVFAKSLVGSNQAPRALSADLAVVEILTVGLGVWVHVRLLLRDALIEVLALPRLVGGRTESFAGRPLLGG